MAKKKTSKKVAKTTTKTTKRAPKKKVSKRPKKYNTDPKPIADLFKSVCPKCGSTERTGYSRTKKRPRPDGSFTVWRRTKCTNCGQARIDRSVET